MLTPEELRSARASASVCAEKLRLPLRSRIWKGQAGEFLGAGVGSSLDFQDHRAYVPGDDPRHINWQAYARSGNYTMKLYREEVRPVIDLVLDASESMFCEQVKARRTAELFHFFADGALRAGASVNLFLVAGEESRSIETGALHNGHWLEVATELQGDSPQQAPTLAALPFRANAFRIFLSDLLYPGDPAETVRLLGQRHGSPIIFAPFTKGEADPEWQGNYEFIDVELHTRHQHRIEPAVLKRYLAAYRNHFSLWKTTSQRYGAGLARVSADLDLESALHAEAVPTGALEVSN